MKYLKMLKDIIHSILFSPAIFMIISLLLLSYMERVEIARIQNELLLTIIICFLLYFIFVIIKDMRSNYIKYKKIIIGVGILEAILFFAVVGSIYNLKELPEDIVFKRLQYSTYFKITCLLFHLLKDYLVSIEEKLKKNHVKI